MKSGIYKLGKWILLVIGTLLFGFIIANKWFWHVPLYSGLFLYFTFLLAIIFLGKYYLFDKIIENKRGIFINFVLLIGIGVIFSGIVSVLYKSFSNNDVINWALYTNNSWIKDWRNFLFMPYNLKTFSLNNYLAYGIIIDAIMICLIILFKYGEFKAKYVDYSLEVILKSFRSNILGILFGTLLMAVPKLYEYPRSLQYLFKVIFLLYLGYLIILLLVTYLDLKKRSKSNLNNKDLYVILNDNNFFRDKGFTKKSDFKGFEGLGKKLFNKLIIENKNFDIVTYTGVRLGLIKEEEYLNVYYLIMLDNFKLRFMDKKSMQELFDKIDDINKKGIKFKIIASKNLAKPMQKIKDKYSFCYKDKLNVPYILKEVKEDQENVKLKNRAQELKNKIGEERQYRYLIYSLDKIINSYNPIENFYTILKMTEYVLHYRALKNIILKGNLDEVSENLKESLKTPTLGTWIGYQSNKEDKNKKYNNPELIKAFNHIDDVLKRPRKFEGKSTCFYQDICTYLLKIRNNILVHGVITYEVSLDLVEDLFTLGENIILAFLELNITILENELIEGLFKKDFQAIEEKEKMFYLYSYGEEKGKNDLFLEYLNYANGQVLVSSQHNKIKIDEKELR